MEKFQHFSVPPKWTHQPQEKIEKIAGESLQLPCQAKGSPQPTVIWKKEVREYQAFLGLGNLFKERWQFFLART